jgi:hypothetical protein
MNKHITAAKTITADYLVIGGGGMGMAFTDSILSDTDATVAIVDRYHQPGGHWNTAYPFVRLHQPSSFYGVNSRHLGSDTLDASGWNKGLYELATNGEVCAYFDAVMQQQFLPSGRVQYFPMCEYLDDGRFKSLVSGEAYEVSGATIVDATYMNVTVPSMGPPDYAVDDGVTCRPLNDLPKLAGQHDNFTVIGAGKTAMDACLFLLRSGLDPDRIAWVMPRDSWMINRAKIQSGREFADTVVKSFSGQMRAMANAASLGDLFAGVVATGHLLRFDEDVWPTMYRCATVTEAELEQLQRIKTIIRQGRVRRLSADQMELEQGTAPTRPDTLYVNCTADGLANRPVEPIFGDGKLTLQSVRTCQQVFSAAFIGHVEASYDDRALKNELCTPVPHPNTDIDFLRSNLQNVTNAACWGRDPELKAWLHNARLDGFTRPENLENARGLPEDLLHQVTGNLSKLIAEAETNT